MTVRRKGYFRHHFTKNEHGEMTRKIALLATMAALFVACGGGAEESMDKKAEEMKKEGEAKMEEANKVMQNGMDSASKTMDNAVDSAKEVMEEEKAPQ